MGTERLHDVPLGMPSPEALHLATAVISRRYVLPETMQHPEVRSECLRLAYMIQAFGYASCRGDSLPRAIQAKDQSDSRFEQV